MKNFLIAVAMDFAGLAAAFCCVIMFIAASTIGQPVLAAIAGLGFLWAAGIWWRQ